MKCSLGPGGPTCSPLGLVRQKIHENTKLQLWFWFDFDSAFWGIQAVYTGFQVTSEKFKGYNRTRQGEKGCVIGRRVARMFLACFLHVSCVLLACFSCFARVFAHVVPCGMPFGDENAHGMPFAARMWWDLSGQKCRLMDFRQKRKVCGATSESKVPTRGFLVKKETMWRNLFLAKIEMVWHDLCHFDLRIFGEKGNNVERPQQYATNSLFLGLPIFQCHVVQIKHSLNSHGTWYNGYYVNGKCMENNIMQGVAYWCAQLEIISVLNR